ncbi:MAG: protein-export chaperone SecB [Alphaproteobacteria bacterium]|nr:protein-export chaperone SecB [Alphaproteobacteria bacterium]
MNDEPQNTNGAAKGQNGPQVPVVIHAQYVKDISFENPNAPETLRPGQGSPEMDININMDARKLETEETDNLYEVVLSLSAKAARNEKTVFLAEIHYGSIVSLPGVPQDTHHPVLLIEVPKTLFPFARQLLAELTQSGGYPPLLLNPVDFRALYMEQFVKENRKAAAG